MSSKVSKRKDYLNWDEYFMSMAKLTAGRSKDPNTQVGACIDNFRGYKKEFEGARIYVDLFPCNECAKKIIQSGIKEVVYLSDKYKDTDSIIASKLMFDTCGVKYRQLNTKKNKDLRISLQPDVVVSYID